MAVTPNSIVTPQGPAATCSIYATAQATYPPTTTPTNSSLGFTAGANGARITRITALPHETTGGACVIQLFRDIGTSGASKYWFKAMASASSDTVSSTDGPTELDAGYSDDNPLILSANERIYWAPSIAKTFCLTVEGANY